MRTASLLHWKKMLEQSRSSQIEVPWIGCGTRGSAWFEYICIQPKGGFMTEMRSTRAVRRLKKYFSRSYWVEQQWASRSCVLKPIAELLLVVNTLDEMTQVSHNKLGSKQYISSLGWTLGVLGITLPLANEDSCKVSIAKCDEVKGLILNSNQIGSK